MSEWQINFYRSGALALFVLIFLLLRHRGGLWRVVRAAGMNAVTAGAFLAIAYVGNIVALMHTTVANAMLLMAVAPLVAAITARVFLGERLSPVVLTGIALAGLGIAIVVGGGVSTGGLYGDLIALTTVVFLGFYAVALRSRPGVDMVPAVLYSGLFGAAIGGFVAFATGEGIAAPARDIGLCVFLGVAQIGIGGILFALAARSVPAAQLTLFALLEPVLQPLWTWLGVGEVPAGATFAGGAVILAAVLIQARERAGPGTLRDAPGHRPGCGRRSVPGPGGGSAS